MEVEMVVREFRCICGRLSWATSSEQILPCTICGDPAASATPTGRFSLPGDTPNKHRTAVLHRSQHGRPKRETDSNFDWPPHCHVGH